MSKSTINNSENQTVDTLFRFSIPVFVSSDVILGLAKERRENRGENRGKQILYYCKSAY